MKITSSILSIPPYISTSWKNIASLQAADEGDSFCLIVLLHNKTKIEIPGLDQPTVARIFEAHAHYHETANVGLSHKNPLDGPFSFSLPLPSSGGMIDSLGPSMQHNDEQSDLPPLNPDVLKKIEMVAKAFGVENLSLLPAPKPECNCIYCQVMRAMGHPHSDLVIEEEIFAEDLKFENWKIKQVGEQLYLVTNPLDVDENYNVFLGDPLGCTCGEKNCEHIREVLKT